MSTTASTLDSRGSVGSSGYAGAGSSPVAKQAPEPGGAAQYKSSREYSSAAQPPQRHNLVVKSPMGRRYLTTATPPKVSSTHSTHDDMDLYRHPRAAGAGGKFDCQKVAGKGTLVRKRDRDSVQSKTSSMISSEAFQEPPRDIQLQRVSSAQRKGSLDSLLDYMDHGESPHTADSDSVRTCWRA